MITKTNYKLFCLRFLKYFTLNLFALLGAMFIARYFLKALTRNIGDASVSSAYSELFEYIATQKVGRQSREEY